MIGPSRVWIGAANRHCDQKGVVETRGCVEISCPLRFAVQTMAATATMNRFEMPTGLF